MELGDGVTSGSSLMPQKKNPDSLELIRGKSGRVMGCLTSLLVTMKGLPMTYNRDMQEDKVPLFEAADQLAGSLEMARVVVGIGQAEPGAAGWPRRRRAGWWPRTWPKRWRAPARRSTRRTRLWGASCWKACAAGKQAGGLDGRGNAAVRARIHGGYGGAARPEARHGVARDCRAAPGREPWRAALAAARQRLQEMTIYDQELPAGADPEADPRQADLTRRKSWRRSCGKQGIAATQVTLSRDIRDLRLVKTREGYQEMAPEETGPQFSAAGGRVPARRAARAEPGGAEDARRATPTRWRWRWTAKSGRRWWAPSPATIRFW